jgi:hypoxanthine phosphoribosyltransferase
MTPGEPRVSRDERIGEVYLAASELRARVGELGAEIARDYAGRDPVLVGALKACVPFVTDLSRALPITHSLDFIELAGYGSAALGGHEQVRFLKDLDLEIAGRHIIIVDEVVDTGLTLHYLSRSLMLRAPESLSCATLFDRPYRRLVDELPIRYVGFTVPDEFFAGYGFDLDERWRNLPDLHLIKEPTEEGSPGDEVRRASASGP